MEQKKEQLIDRLAIQLGLSVKQVTAVVVLLEAGATIPFIARYRKEMTGSLNEVQIAAIRDGMDRLQALEDRRAYILNTIAEQGNLTPELEQAIQQANDNNTLEDLYLPFKPKRRTRATIARERGLEPLAKVVMSQRASGELLKIAEEFVNPDMEVLTPQDALAGVRDIIAEWINENARARSRVRYLFMRKATLRCRVIRGREEEAQKYRDYFDWSEAAGRIPSHRFLAIQRGVNEEMLRMSIEPEEEAALDALHQQFIRAENESADQVRDAIKDCYHRLMAPSLENEVVKWLKERSDRDAIDVFAASLGDLLMAAPLGQKRVLAIDPGFKAGCKVACLDEQGKLLHSAIFYPHDRDAMKRFDSTTQFEYLVDKYQPQAIAIGNGTAGRETFDFIQKFQLEDLLVVMVNESGASVYSASEVAREEFPDDDITIRSAVSIGRRLMDPLAELVKIDPKAIGVGQYQHDVDQNELKRKLDDVVINCVNKVGVEVNTASKQLLTYVSGIGEKLAQNIIQYRNENGPFRTKADFIKVRGLGPKAFEQCAGFLRIRGAENPLDASSVHPESYEIVERMANDNGCSIRELITNKELRRSIDLIQYTSDVVGMPTLNDIMAELTKPGRDPRQKFEMVEFDKTINGMEDLREDMIIPGVIMNITNFGAFVDVGVHQNGLIHISDLFNKLGKDAKEKIHVNQRIKVRVLSIEPERKRIGLELVTDSDKI